MRVLLADSNHPVLHEMLQKVGYECDLFWDKPVDELIDILPNYDVLVIRSKFLITSDILDRCKRLKCIGRVGAGMENIDLKHAEQKKVICLNVPEGNRDAVGEHAMGMLLMLMNHLKRADAEVRQGIWRRAENRGHEIKGKTVGVIGFGNTGAAFANKLSGFECEILAYDKYRDIGTIQGIRDSELKDLYNKCDIVSLHLPLTQETKYFADKAFFDQFKKPIYFINTARGKCLNTNDLLAAIAANKVIGACLDVLEFESDSFESTDESNKTFFDALFKNDKIIFSPHIAGWTHESNYKMSLLMAEKIISALAT